MDMGVFRPLAIAFPLSFNRQHRAMVDLRIPLPCLRPGKPGHQARWLQGHHSRLVYLVQGWDTSRLQMLPYRWGLHSGRNSRTLSICHFLLPVRFRPEQEMLWSVR